METKNRPEKIGDFMSAIMKEARRNSLVAVCESWDISEEEMDDCIAYIEEKLDVAL